MRLGDDRKLLDINSTMEDKKFLQEELHNLEDLDDGNTNAKCKIVGVL